MSRWSYKNRKEYMLKRRNDNLERAVSYKGNKCAFCGKPYERDLFHFHHRIRANKSFGIAGNLTKSWESLQKELDKCDLLCLDCHRNTYQFHFSP